MSVPEDGKTEHLSHALRYCDGQRDYLPYPSHARGFLYYHPPNSNIFAPEFDDFDVGHLRFRCVDSPQTPFQAGSDLLLTSGAPWHCSGKRFMEGVGLPLFNLALREGLITMEEVSAWSLVTLRYTHLSSVQRMRYIRKFDQPFVLHLSNTTNNLQLASGHLGNEGMVEYRLRTGLYNSKGAKEIMKRCYTKGEFCALFLASNT